MPISRSAKTEEIEALVALADRTFRKPGQASMGTAYASLLSKENADNLLVMEEDGLPATLVGLLPARLSVVGCSIPVVSMGAVCTDAAYRGRNFADMLVKQSIVKCAEAGAQLLLISGTRGLYSRNDCLEVGEVQYFTIYSADELSTLNRAKEAVIRPYNGAEDRNAMLKLLGMEAAYYERTDEGLDKLIASAAIASNDGGEQHVWISSLNDGQVCGYLVFALISKEDESVLEVVEYAGSDEAVLGLLYEALLRYPAQQMHVPVMRDRAALSEQLASAGCAFREIPIPGTIRMIDFPGLWNSLKPYMERRLGADRFSLLSLTVASNGFILKYKGNTLTLGHRGATTLVFNGPTITESNELKLLLAELFPLPFPYTQNLNFI